MNYLQYIDALAWIVGTWILLVSFSCTKLINRLFPDKLGVIDRAVICLFVACFTICGWTKGPITPEGRRPLFNFIMALRTGGLTGDNGMLARKTEVETIAAFSDLADAMLVNGSNIIAQSEVRFAAAEFAITNNPPELVYIQSFFPRSDPSAGLTNHNLAALAMRQATAGATLSRWVYFSSELAVEPTLYAEVAVGGDYVRLNQATNTWPATELFDGLPCVRYDYTLPPSMQGLVFSPDFDLRFGSELNGLQIGGGGLIITDENNVSHLGVDATHIMCNGRVEVLYKSGLAVRIRVDGQDIKDNQEITL